MQTNVFIYTLLVHFVHTGAFTLAHNCDSPNVSCLSVHCNTDGDNNNYCCTSLVGLLLKFTVLIIIMAMMKGKLNFCPFE